MAGEKVNLTGARETLLMTLYGKALESRLPDSLLRDRFADEAVRKIDYDFSSNAEALVAILLAVAILAITFV